VFAAKESPIRIPVGVVVIVFAPISILSAYTFIGMVVL
jgi:hypothetical protein